MDNTNNIASQDTKTEHKSESLFDIFSEWFAFPAGPVENDIYYFYYTFHTFCIACQHFYNLPMSAIGDTTKNLICNEKCKYQELYHRSEKMRRKCNLALFLEKEILLLGISNKNRKAHFEHARMADVLHKRR